MCFLEFVCRKVRRGIPLTHLINKVLQNVFRLAHSKHPCSFMPSSKIFQASCEKKKQVNNLDKNSLVLNFKTKILSWQASMVFESGVYGIFIKVFKSKKLIDRKSVV